MEASHNYRPLLRTLKIAFPLGNKGVLRSQKEEVFRKEGDGGEGKKRRTKRTATSGQIATRCAAKLLSGCLSGKVSSQLRDPHAISSQMWSGCYGGSKKALHDMGQLRKPQASLALGKTGPKWQAEVAMTCASEPWT